MGVYYTGLTQGNVDMWLISPFCHFIKQQLQPLTLSEYNRLVKILIENKLRPGDLLSAKGLDTLSKVNNKKIKLWAVKNFIRKRWNFSYCSGKVG